MQVQDGSVVLCARPGGWHVGCGSSFSLVSLLLFPLSLFLFCRGVFSRERFGYVFLAEVAKPRALLFGELIIAENAQMYIHYAGALGVNSSVVVRCIMGLFSIEGVA